MCSTVGNLGSRVEIPIEDLGGGRYREIAQPVQIGPGQVGVDRDISGGDQKMFNQWSLELFARLPGALIAHLVKLHTPALPKDEQQERLQVLLQSHLSSHLQHMICSMLRMCCDTILMGRMGWCVKTKIESLSEDPDKLERQIQMLLQKTLSEIIQDELVQLPLEPLLTLLQDSIPQGSDKASLQDTFQRQIQDRLPSLRQNLFRSARQKLFRSAYQNLRKDLDELRSKDLLQNLLADFNKLQNDDLLQNLLADLNKLQNDDLLQNLRKDRNKLQNDARLQKLLKAFVGLRNDARLQNLFKDLDALRKDLVELQNEGRPQNLLKDLDALRKEDRLQNLLKDLVELQNDDFLQNLLADLNKLQNDERFQNLLKDLVGLRNDDRLQNLLKDLVELQNEGRLQNLFKDLDKLQNEDCLQNLLQNRLQNQLHNRLQGLQQGQLKNVFCALRQKLLDKQEWPETFCVLDFSIYLRNRCQDRFQQLLQGDSGCFSKLFEDLCPPPEQQVHDLPPLDWRVCALRYDLVVDLLLDSFSSLLEEVLRKNNHLVLAEEQLPELYRTLYWTLRRDVIVMNKKEGAKEEDLLEILRKALEQSSNSERPPSEPAPHQGAALAAG